MRNASGSTGTASTRRTRKIWVRRIDRDGEIVDTTKTGESGFRDIPMSPILVAALDAWRARLRGMGYRVEGEEPVLVTARGPVWKYSIAQNHWATIAVKSGFTDADGGHRYTFYCLRHTAATLWRAIGIDTDDVQYLMGHEDYKTTVENYLHKNPGYDGVIRPEVEGFMRQHLLARTPEGYIDALGYVLARRWKAAGIPIDCATPRAETQRLDHDGALALPAPVLDLAATDVSTKTASVSGPTIKSLEDLREWQRARSIELHGQGWTKTRIAAELRCDHTTVDFYLRHAGFPHARGKLKPERRQELKQRIIQYREEHPDASPIEVGQALGEHARRITLLERGRGKPMGRPRPGHHLAYKLAPHEAAIRRMAAEAKTFREMARALPGNISFSAIAAFAKKRGIKTKRWGSGARVDQYDAEIRRMVAEGKDGREIARELHTVYGELAPSHSGVCRRINALDIQSESERHGAAARARAKKALQRQELAVDLGKELAAPDPASAEKLRKIKVIRPQT